MSAFVVRACCASSPPWSGLVEAEDETDGISYGLTGKPGPIIDRLDEAPTVQRWIALHEGGHAVVAHALGRRIASVSVAPPARVIFAPDVAPLTPIQRIAESFAGQAGEMTEHRAYSSMHQDDEADYLQRVHDFRCGQCDGCRMAGAAWQSVGFPAGAEAARMVMRAGQRLAVDFLSTHRNRLALDRLADRLRVDHRLDGAEVHKIIEPYVEFGSLRAPSN